MALPLARENVSVPFFTTDCAYDGTLFTGASLTSARLIVIVAERGRAGAPLSVTWTVIMSVGAVLKSSAAALTTVRRPLLGSMAKAPLALPPVIWYVRTCPASGSLATTVPTTVPAALFSSRRKDWSAISGGRLGGALAKTGMPRANSDVSPKGAVAVVVAVAV